MESTNPPSEETVSEPPVRSSTLSVWVYCALIITTISLSLLLLVVIVARKNLRQRVFNQLVVSMAFGAVIFNLFVRPGTIQDEGNTYEMNKGYCVIYLLLQKVEWYFMPLMFWMMSIERLIALREPENYFEKMTKGARAALIAVPWCYGVAITILTIYILGGEIITRYGPYPDDPYFDEMSQYVHIQCMMLYSQSNEQIAAILMLVFGTIIPVLALSASGLALLIVYFRRRGVKVCDSEGQAFVSVGSIILCLLLNLSAVLILLANQTLANVATIRFLYTHWPWSFVELFAAILAMCMLPDVRRVMGVICYCCKKPDEEKAALLGVSKETQTSNTSIQSE